MNLKNITHKKCPTCNGEIVGESIEDKNRNDEWVEIRKFSCGTVVLYSPNSRMESFRAKCPKNPEMIKRIELRKLARLKLLENISDLDVDSEFKNELYQAVSAV